MSNKILDNRQHGNVGDYLKENIKKDSDLYFVSAYFTIYAFNALKKELKKINELNFLFGEPTFVKTDNFKEQKQFVWAAEERENSVGNHRYELQMKNNLSQKSIAKACADWIRKKVQIRSLIKPDFLHGKAYIIDNPGKKDLSIVGSSNFTSSGLGFNGTSNMELNIATKEQEDVQKLKKWFKDLWNNEKLTEDVKQKVLDCIEQLYIENSPEYVYFVTIYNIFREFIEELNDEDILNTRLGFSNSEIWKMLYRFQKDAVIGAINKIEKYNGCIIADSVGLGKTFEALAIIKYYELRNFRVLVLAPKKLRENWTLYNRTNDTNNFLSEDRFRYDVLNHTDLSREQGMSGDINLESINWGNYDLIVIDESHNFRNNNPVKGRLTRYQKLMQDIIQSGINTKVLMLSATPINNRMADLKNQVAFITAGDDQHLLDYIGLKSINQTLVNSQRQFNRWADLSDNERTLHRLLEMLNMDYFRLLETLTIARSRKHIEKYYNTSEIGEFPERLRPDTVKADIADNGDFPEYKSINREIRRLRLAIYSPMEYVLPHKKEEYERKYEISIRGGETSFRQSDREKYLIYLMRINILKRLESSVNSFGITVKKMLDKTKAQLEALNNHSEADYSLNINDIEVDSPEFENVVLGDKIKILIQDIDQIKLRQALDDDIDKLEYLYAAAYCIDAVRDKKLKELKEKIKQKATEQINEGNNKVLIFTAFADTAQYLYENIADWASKELGLFSAVVTGNGSNKTNLLHCRTEFNNLLATFSPISNKKKDIGKEIDILIATDCISEGQNLQDCDTLINYDIHWNPVRIIQRFGRIDRIGSKNKKIKLINFWPNVGLDEYINLESRVQNRMVLLDVSATGEENLIKGSDINKMNDLDYRKKQLEQLQVEIVDMEELAGGISITDLNLDDFKMDLIQFEKDNPGKLSKAPTGIHSIVPINQRLENDADQGVIFCLKQISGSTPDEDKNALHPYYLIYVTDEHEIKLRHINSKRILDIYKGFCLGESEPYEWLCEIFNKETNEGENMTKYTDMLRKVIDDILGQVEQMGLESLFTKGGTSILNNRIRGLDDFELITFLIMKKS